MINIIFQRLTPRCYNLIVSGFASLFFSIILSACGDDGEHVQPENEAQAVVADSLAAANIAWQSQPPQEQDPSAIVVRRCSKCHSNFTILNNAQAKSAIIARKVESKAMPYPGSEEAESMSDDERSILVNWANEAASSQ